MSCTKLCDDGSGSHLFECQSDFVHASFKQRIRTSCFCDFFDAMDNCRVVSSAESMADFHKLSSKQLTCEEHRNLSGKGQGLGSCFGSKSFWRNAPFTRCGLLDCWDGESWLISFCRSIRA